MTEPEASDHGYLAVIEAEGQAWYEITGLIRRLTPAERLQAGYNRDPDWSIRDLAAHLGTWLAEAHLQFERILAGTYEGHNVDIDGLNAALLEAMRDQPWDVVWSQANAARTKMVGDWSRLPEESAEAEWWIVKAGPSHYAEHLPRLRLWVEELVDGRTSRVRPLAE